MPPAVLLAALFAVLFWGGSPVATKLAVEALPPIPMSAVRAGLAAPVGVALALLLRIPLPRRGRQAWLLTLCAFCGFIGFPVIFSYGIARTSAIHGAMILAMLPVFTGAIAHALEGRVPGRMWWIGCAIAVGGEAVLIFGRAGAAEEASLTGDAICMVAAVIASTGYVTGARLSQAGYPSQGTTYWGIALATLAYLPFMPWVSQGVDWAAVPWRAWASVVYLGLGVSTLGYVIWYWALGKGGIARIGVLQFLQPVAGVALAWGMLGEPLTGTVLSATGVILAGVVIATRR